VIRVRVAAGSAVGPVVRSAAVSSAGQSRLAVFVVGRVPSGFVFVLVFVSEVAGMFVKFVLRVRAVFVGFVVWAVGLL